MYHDDLSQPGVKEVEATRSVWTPGLLKIAYLFIFLVALGNSLESQTSASLTEYVTSDFSEHALISTISVTTGLVAGMARIPIAKLIDIWGRGEGYVTMVACTTLGLIMMASCNSVPTYAVAQIFYWLGFDGVGYILTVFLADTSSLKNRALAFSFSTTPYIVTAFAGPAVAQWFLSSSSWRWAYAVFAITTPLVSTPVVFLLFYTKHKAVRTGILRPASSKRKEPCMVQAKKLLVQFDVVGSILFTTGLALILLPLSLRSDPPAGWLDPSTLFKPIAGYSCLCLFLAWETKFAAVQLVPYRILADRTILSCCILSFTSFACFNSTHTYLPSYLLLVHALPLAHSGPLANLFTLTSCTLSLLFALALRRSHNRFKPLALSSLPPHLLSSLLLIPLIRNPSTPTPSLVLTQLISAAAGTALAVANTAALNAAVPHEDLAMAMAVQGLCGAVGGSLGTAVAGMVWTGGMPGLLREELGKVGKGELAGGLYESLKKQLEWGVGSEAREAVARAYCVVLGRLFVGAAVVGGLVAVACVVAWRDCGEEEEKGGGKEVGRRD